MEVILNIVNTAEGAAVNIVCLECNQLITTVAAGESIDTDTPEAEHDCPADRAWDEHERERRAAVDR